MYKIAKGKQKDKAKQQEVHTASPASGFTPEKHTTPNNPEATPLVARLFRVEPALHIHRHECKHTSRTSVEARVVQLHVFLHLLE